MPCSASLTGERSQAAGTDIGPAQPRARQAGGEAEGTSIGIAGGLGVAAAVLAVYGIGFAFATVAAGLSEVLAWWLSLLIVTAMISLLAAIAAFLAKRFARKASPPKPAAAIEEAERTIGTLQSHV